MKRRKFLTIAGGSIVTAGGGFYLLSDKSNVVRGDNMAGEPSKVPLKADERTILRSACLAPSGHNTQPWLVKYLEPFHWIVGSDKTRWLHAVDPNQRETMLSIGAFLQNMEYAAANLGYQCDMTLLAANNQAMDIVDVVLRKTGNPVINAIEKMEHRRTIRSNFLGDVLKKEELDYLVGEDKDYIQYLPNTSKEHQWLNEQTIEANRLQCSRYDAQDELSDWIRFSSKDAAQHLDGLTLASMEIAGIPAWYLRNFYTKKDVMAQSFKDQSIDKVVKQVSRSAGWLIISSKDESVTTLLATGKRLQRLWLKTREKNIAIHPMTQIIEEPATAKLLGSSIGINMPIQFLLRTGYVTDYPAPVSLRRPVEKFIVSI